MYMCNLHVNTSQDVTTLSQSLTRMILWQLPSLTILVHRVSTQTTLIMTKAVTKWTTTTLSDHAISINMICWCNPTNSSKGKFYIYKGFDGSFPFTFFKSSTISQNIEEMQVPTSLPYLFWQNWAKTNKDFLYKVIDALFFYHRMKINAIQHCNNELLWHRH